MSPEILIAKYYNILKYFNGKVINQRVNSLKTETELFSSRKKKYSVKYIYIFKTNDYI